MKLYSEYNSMQAKALYYLASDYVCVLAMDQFDKDCPSVLKSDYGWYFNQSEAL